MLLYNNYKRLFEGVLMDILHCDLDAFFAAVEQRDHPELRGKPVIVGGMPGSRGVVSTCSYEARAQGVHSAMPAAEAFRLCPQAVFIPPDMNKYSTASQQVFSIFKKYTPLIEPLSIDEAFLDVSGCHGLFGTSREIALRIKREVLEQTGLVISIGIAANKFLAKLATNLSKPDGLMEFGPEAVKEILPALPVGDLWGIGGKTAARLNQAGIYTISDLTDTPAKRLKPILGSSTDFYLNIASGIDTREVSPRGAAQSIGNETTFPQDLSTPEELEPILLELSSKVGFRLRQASLRGSTIQLKMKTAEFKTYTRSTRLAEPAQTDLLIYHTALELYHRSGMAGKKLRLIGVSCSHFAPDGLEQGSLFGEKDSSDHHLDQIMDALNNKYGKGAVTRAVLLRKK